MQELQKSRQSSLEHVDDGIPEVRGELIKENGSLEKNISKYRFISEETSNRFVRTRLREGDFVLSVRGTIGKVAIIHKEIEGANMTANLVKISPKRKLSIHCF
jgi:type I restriction enzyme, S subunit